MRTPRKSVRVLWLVLSLMALMFVMIQVRPAVVSSRGPRPHPHSVYPVQPEHRCLVPPHECIGTIAQLTRNLRLSSEVASSTLALGSETIYATGLIGYEAILPPSKAHYDLILQHPCAADIFLSLYYATDATNEGKMHALRGLRQTHPFAYDEIAATLKSSDILITVMHGCIMESVPVQNVVTEIEREVSFYGVCSF